MADQPATLEGFQFVREPGAKALTVFMVSEGKAVKVRLEMALGSSSEKILDMDKIFGVPKFTTELRTSIAAHLGRPDLDRSRTDNMVVYAVWKGWSMLHDKRYPQFRKSLMLYPDSDEQEVFQLNPKMLVLKIRLFYPHTARKEEEVEAYCEGDAEQDSVEDSGEHADAERLVTDTTNDKVATAKATTTLTSGIESPDSADEVPRRESEPERAMDSSATPGMSKTESHRTEGGVRESGGRLRISSKRSRTRAKKKRAKKGANSLSASVIDEPTARVETQTVDTCDSKSASTQNEGPQKSSHAHRSPEDLYSLPPPRTKPTFEEMRAAARKRPRPQRVRHFLDSGAAVSSAPNTESTASASETITSKRKGKQKRQMQDDVVSTSLRRGRFAETTDVDEQSRVDIRTESSDGSQQQRSSQNKKRKTDATSEKDVSILSPRRTRSGRPIDTAIADTFSVDDNGTAHFDVIDEETMHADGAEDSLNLPPRRITRAMAAQGEPFGKDETFNNVQKDSPLKRLARRISDTFPTIARLVGLS